MDMYIDVDGHPTWVSDDGSPRPPVLLLHGGLSSSETNWFEMAGRLADHHRVVMFDRRGHGRTGDTAAAFHYRSMAVETAGVIEALNLAPVAAVGYSDGANLVMHLALMRPELLRCMVLISGNYHHEALYPDGLGGVDDIIANALLSGPYGAASPDGGDHWPVVVAKGMTLFDEEPTFTVEQLSHISTPTLVVAADDDLFPLEHTVSLYDALPAAQLAIVPGASHLLVIEQPARLTELINNFLSSPDRPPTFLPVKR